MSNIIFAAISPHPPIILPEVGNDDERKAVKYTIQNLEKLGQELKKSKPDKIIISSPHQDWGFNVPLYFLAKDFKGEIMRYQMGLQTPEFYFKEGKTLYEKLDKDKKYALIASGDLSHCLTEEGPYGFESDGPKFDKDLIKFLKEKDPRIFQLEEIYPKAGECGLRSFCFMLGILKGANIEWETDVLSYEGPFGVGYLVADFKLNNR